MNDTFRKNERKVSLMYHVLRAKYHHLNHSSFKTLTYTEIHRHIYDK